MDSERKIRLLGKEIDPKYLAARGLLLMMISWPIGVNVSAAVGVSGMLVGAAMIGYACGKGIKLEQNK